MKHEVIPTMFHLKTILLVTTAAIVGILPIGAQTTGTLNGKVTAANGTPVANAPITLTNNGTGQSQRALSANDGTFQVSDLPPGTYEIDVEAPGFKRLAEKDVLLNASGSSINLTVQAGNSSETVTVAGMTGLIQDESSETSRSYDTRFVREVPLRERNVQKTVDFMPGVTTAQPTGQDPLDPQQRLTWNANGQLSEANRQNYDGIQNDEPMNGYQVHTPTLESVEQFNVSTSNYDASQGRAAGSITNAISRTGANGLHGSLFAFNDNSWAAARDYFNPVGTPQSGANLNQFGASLGGPIIKDKTFFFGSWESDYNNSYIPSISTVPDANFRAGNFTEVPNLTLYDPLTGLNGGTQRAPFAGNTIPVNRNALASSLLGYIPMPNLPGYEDNYYSTPHYQNDDLRFEGRLDHRFGDKGQAYLRYGYTNDYVNQASPYGDLLGFDNEGRVRSDSAMAGYTTTGSASLIWDVRAGFNRYDDRVYGNNIGLGSTLPSILIDGMSTLGMPANYPQTNVDSTLNIESAWSKRLGIHDIRFGVDMWGIRADGFQSAAYGPQGGYVFGPGGSSLAGALNQGDTFAQSFASFLLGAPTAAGIGSSLLAPSTYEYQYAGFVADRVQFHKLTVDLGLRYEYYDPLKNRYSTGAYSFSPTTDTLVPLNQGSTGGVNANYLNFAPRIGLAYSLTPRTVIRTGYGIQYFNGYLGAAQNSFITSNSLSGYGSAGGFGGAATFGDLSAASLANVPFIVQAVRQRTPYTQTYNFSVQQDLGRGILVDAAYVGNVSRFLPYFQELNAGLPGAGLAGLPYNTAALGDRTASTLLYGHGLNSNYNSLQVNATKRFSAGLAFSAAYTFSKSLDYGGTDNPAVLSNFGLNYGKGSPYSIPQVLDYSTGNARYNYGPSDFNRTNLFTLSHVWQLPFGPGSHYLSSGVLGHILGPWELNGIFHYASGMPYTPVADSISCNCPNTATRADLVPSGTSSVVTYVPSYFGFYPVYSNVQNYALESPAAGSIGNAGRNILVGPNLVNYDLALFRSFQFFERARLEVRGQAYNLFNSTHFANPIANVNSSNFGSSIATLPGYGNRTLQIGLRLTF